MTTFETQVHKAFNTVFLTASGFAIAVILSCGMVSTTPGEKAAQMASSEVWECNTDMECEQEYFDRFGDWPLDESQD